MKTINWKIILAFSLTALASSCVKIPEGYFGNFTDPSNGATLVLNQNKAEFNANGRRWKASSKDLSFDHLNEGKAGLYDTEDKASGQIEVYFVTPVAGTRQEQAGFVWMQSEVLYTYFSRHEQNQVPAIQMVHCTNGTILLDTQTQRIQVGCPEGPMTYNLQRTR